MPAQGVSSLAGKKQQLARRLSKCMSCPARSQYTALYTNALKQVSDGLARLKEVCSMEAGTWSQAGKVCIRAPLLLSLLNDL